MVHAELLSLFFFFHFFIVFILSLFLSLFPVLTVTIFTGLPQTLNSFHALILFVSFNNSISQSKTIKKHTTTHLNAPKNMSLQLVSTTAPLPSTVANFSTKLTYSARLQLLGYYNLKSCYLVSLNPGEVERYCKNVLQFSGHATSNVTCMSFSAFGNHIASGDEQGKVFIWEVYQDSDSKEYVYKIKGEFQVLSGTVKDISWDFEGKRLCVVGDGSNEFGKFITWDSGNSVGEVSGHSSMINTCCINPNGRPFRSFTCDNEGSVVFYTGVPFKFKSSDRDHHDRGKFIRQCSMNDDGSLMCSVGSDRKVVLYDGKTGDFLKFLENSEKISSGYYGCCWLNEKRLIVIGSTIGLYEDSKLVKTWTYDEINLKCNQNSNAADKSPQKTHLYVGITKIDSNSFVVVRQDGLLQKITIEPELKIDFTINGHSKGITSLQYDFDHAAQVGDVQTAMVLSGSFDGKILESPLSTIDNPTESKSFSSHNNSIISLSFDIENGTKTFNSCSWDASLLKTSSTGENVEQYKFPSQPKLSFSFEINKTFLLLVVDFDNNVSIIDTKNFHLVKFFDNNSKTNGSFLTEQEIVCCTMNKDYIVFGYAKTNEIQVFPYTLEKHDDNIKNITVDSSSSFTLCQMINTPSCLSITSKNDQSITTNYISCGDILGKIMLYDLETKILKTSRWAFHSGKITSMSWNPSNDFIVTGSLDTHLMVYSLNKPMKVIKFLNAHKDGVTIVLWIDEHTIVSAGLDGCIKKWLIEF